MENENPFMEADLQAFAPCKIDDAFLTRIESCVVGTWVELTDEEAAFENQLRTISPARFDNAQLDALEAACLDTTPSQPSVIIAMPDPKSLWTSRSWLAAAAIIALLGAVTALLLPPSIEKPPVTANNGSASTPKLPLNNFTPASYNRNLNEARSQGVIWRDSEPQRIIRVVYTERVTLNNSKGETVEVERPRIEYILLPAKVD